MSDSDCILALDLGKRTGYAVGPPHCLLRSGAVELPPAPDDAGAELKKWLIAQIDLYWPALIVKEAPLLLAGFLRNTNSQQTVEFTYGIHFLVQTISRVRGIPWKNVYPSTVRKHYCGSGRAKKPDVLTRCHVLGDMPRGNNDMDQADAIAIFNWASSKYRTDQLHHKLFLYNEQPAAAE